VRFTLLWVALALGLTLALGCAKSKQEPSGAPSSRPGKSAGPSLPALAEVHESVQKGAYDDAAKRLLELRATGHEFSPREAADYRSALDEAYTRALEAAEKGDTRAQEAIAIIRAGHPH
jgi:hypothetical protein